MQAANIPGIFNVYSSLVHPVGFFLDWMLTPRFPYKVAINDQQDLWARGQQYRR